MSVPVFCGRLVERIVAEAYDQWDVTLLDTDLKTDPYQLSHAAWHALTLAVDHLHCLRNSGSTPLLPAPRARRAPGRRTKDQRVQQLRELAVAAGVPDPDVKKAVTPPQYSHIVREAGDLTVLGADLADVIWSGCSSIAHGDLTGTLGILDKQIVAREKGVAYARVTGSISGLVLDHRRPRSDDRAGLQPLQTPRRPPLLTESQVAAIRRSSQHCP